MEWLHLPIVDADIPDEAFERSWQDAGPRLRAWLGESRRILLHCRGGLGRTGTIAARMLIELGTEPGAAVKAVRAARAGTLETWAQEAYVRALTRLSDKARCRRVGVWCSEITPEDLSPWADCGDRASGKPS
jgi:ADP-ribosyl-[dinitrogen reductase] hydrolase